MNREPQARRQRFAYRVFAVYTALIVTAILVILVWGGRT